MSNKVICFTCFTIQNIFISYLLTKTIYKNDYCILILSDWNCSRVYRNIIENSKDIWDKVVLIEEAGKMTKSERFKKINDQLIKIDFSNIDVIHYFQMNQNSYLNVLFSYIHCNTKVIITVYTASTYYIKEYINFAKEYYKRRNEDININTKRINEVWVYDKNLFIGDKYNIKIKDIEIFKYLRNKNMLNNFCIDLNKIFNYTNHNLNYDVVFLDQYLKRYFQNDMEEMRLMESIISTLFDKKVLIKLHPSVNTEIDKYDNYNVSIIKENTVPWEVILLNEINNNNLNNTIFISYYSESLFTTHIYLNKLKISHLTLCLKNILNVKKTINKDIGEYLFHKYINKIKEVYTDYFYEIKSIEELKTFTY